MEANLLSETIKTEIAVSVTAGAAGTSAINGAVFDTAGFAGVLMIVQMGAIVAGAVTSIKAQQGEQANLSDAADLLGTAQTIADTDDEKVFIIDIKKPIERYVRLVVSRATQNATLTALYVGYGADRRKSIAQGTNVAIERFASPIEGTA